MITIWPVGIRLIHWIVAGACVFNFWISEEGEIPHRYAGYLAAAVVVLRLFWGVFSSQPELKLSSMWGAAREVPVELKRLLSRQALSLTRGHSPLASPVMLAMWGLVLALGVSGWMLGLDAFFGSELLEESHELCSHALQLLVVAHLTGIAHETLGHRWPAWRAMIDGKKKI